MNHSKRVAARVLAAAAVIGLAGCAANPTNSLERVAKDWALTIRASQIIPVYPLSEDIQPGDVFLVPTSISEQTSIYEEKGFLPTDQLVVRLRHLDYCDFYKSGYWTGDYDHLPHKRPGSLGKVEAPRAAFPTYSFSVDRSAGLQLALPIHGIPFGLGIMGAKRAAGTVTIADSYTYGIDGTNAYTALITWYDKKPVIKYTLGEIARSSSEGIFLRVVTRVYLTRKLDVSLENTGTVSAGADVGKSLKLKLPTLNVSNPASAAAAASAYKAAMGTLSAPLNGTGTGVAVRFTQASSRSVSMQQTFDRPLVIGFVGFDVKVFKDGNLSAPIPSFAVLNGAANEGEFVPFCGISTVTLNQDYVTWLEKNTDNPKRMKQWLQKQGKTDLKPSDLEWNCKYQQLLQQANADLHIQPKPKLPSPSSTSSQKASTRSQNECGCAAHIKFQ